MGPAKQLRSLCLAFIVVLATASTVLAWVGKVVRISDGDTITVLHEKRPERVRLYGIDCPESRQAFGYRATQFTENAVLGKMVEVHPFDVDQYGNTVGIVRVKGIILNEELIRAGLAWVYTHYCHLGLCQKWKGLMTQARSERQGLWAGSNPSPPWKYRREKRQ